jgi:hypothetical protein
MSEVTFDLGDCNHTMAWQLQDLCLEKHSFLNDLGSQLEVSAHSSFSKGQKSVCDMERMVCSHLLQMLLCYLQCSFVGKGSCPFTLWHL